MSGLPTEQMKKFNPLALLWLMHKPTGAQTQVEASPGSIMIRMASTREDNLGHGEPDQRGRGRKNNTGLRKSMRCPAFHPR